MYLEELIGLSIFGTLFGSIFLLSIAEFLGKLYGSYSCLSRTDLTGEQRLIYLIVIWFIPLGWLIYILLGQERTQEIFSEANFL